MHTNLLEILNDIEKLPQNSKIQNEYLNLPKTNKKLVTQIYIQILRISMPKQLLSTKNLIFCFQNIFSLPYFEFIKNIKIIADYKLVLALPFDLYKNFISECLSCKKKLNFENNVIEADNMIDKYVFDMILIYYKEKKEYKTDIFKFIMNNKKYKVVKDLLNDSIFINDINWIEDDKDYIDVLQILSKRQKSKLAIRRINNKTLLKKYIELLTHKKGEVKNKAKRHKKSTEKIQKIEVNLEKVNMDKNNAENKDNNDDEVNESEIFSDCNENDCKIYQKLYQEYNDNTFVKLMLCFERDCCRTCVKILETLKTDEDYRIRAKSNVFGVIREDRIFDSCKKVRDVIFDRITKENHINDNVLLKMFTGLKTNAKEDYISFLDSIELDFGFLVRNLNDEIRNYMKLKYKMYKKNKQDDVYKNITNVAYKKNNCINAKMMFCEYFINHAINEQEVISLLVDEPFCGFLYLKSRLITDDQYMKCLHDNAHKIVDNNNFIRVVYFMKDYININKTLIDVAKDNLLTKIDVNNAEKQNEIAKNEHKFTFEQTCIYNSIFVDDTQTDLDKCIESYKHNFYIIFYAAKHVKSNINIREIVNDYIKNETDNIKILQIISKCNDLDILINNIDKVFNLKQQQLPQYMFENVKATNLILLFLSGYITNVYKESFITKILYVISKGCSKNFNNYKDTVSNLLKKYFKNLSDNDKCQLLQLCVTLKHYSINVKNNDYKIIDGKINIESVPSDDFALYYLLDYIKELIGRLENESNIDTKNITIDSSLFKLVDAKYQPYINVVDFTKL